MEKNNKNEPNGRNLYETLIKLLADQEGVKITYSFEENEKVERK